MAHSTEAMQVWLAKTAGISAASIEPVSGDASFRRYFRVQQAGMPSQILMDAPPDKENSAAFLLVAEKLRAAGLHAPEIMVADEEQGLLLLEDLGDDLYLSHLDAATAPRLYGDALSALLAMQACVKIDGLPSYDAALLRAEMELFRDWLCLKHLDLHLSEAEQGMLDDVFHLLTQNALEQPQVFVHRDYHSRNLLITAAPSPGIIDFQDAVSGPITYDLVSLLKDAYKHWPLEQVDQWALGYAELAHQSGLLRTLDEDTFLRWFDLMGLQRHIKIAGIFARLFRRDNKAGYLADIPLVLDYMLAMTQRHHQFEPLGELLLERVLPAMQQTSD